MPKKDLYKFSLRGINLTKLDQKYEIPSEKPYIPKNATKLDELDTKNIPEIYSFLDEAKKPRKCVISFLDYSKKEYKCYWDKHEIPSNIIPIGCPIKYVADKAIKSYHSEISKEPYSIRENITRKRRDELRERNKEDQTDPNGCLSRTIRTEDGGYYESEGIFCSFNCCQAYIENETDPLYKNSRYLLLDIYNEFNESPEKSLTIMPAPHWKLLKDFGGKLSIAEFRDSFNRILYKDYGLVSFRSYGRIFEDQLKL